MAMEQYAHLLMSSSACGVLCYPSKMLKGNSVLLYNTTDVCQSFPRDSQGREVLHSDFSHRKKNEGRGPSPSPVAADAQQNERRYAGPKFAHAPLPGDLPKPPSHWMSKKAQAKYLGADGTIRNKTVAVRGTKSVSSDIYGCTNVKCGNGLEVVDVEELTSQLKRLLKVQMS